MRRVLSLAGSLALLLVVPALASAPFKGKTSQGLPVRVEVYKSGAPSFVLVNWRAPCTPNHHLRAWSSWRFKRNNTSRRGVNGAGKVAYKGFHGRFIRARPHVTVRRASATRWHGTFRATATVYRGKDGPVLRHCRLRTVHWSATRPSR